MLISNILTRAVNLYPDKEAVISGNNSFTYAEFGQRVNRLAHYLSSAGMGLGDCLAALLYNDHHFMETYFGVAKIGAILNPLNYRLSGRELGLILNDSKARFLIADRSFRSQVEELIGEGVNLESVLWVGSGEDSPAFHALDYEEVLDKGSPGSLPDPEITDDTVAHLYYTSGTTGRPKGVMLTHRNVCTHSLGAIAELNLSDGDVWIHVAPMFHLADAWATFAITWVGGKHVMVAEFEPYAVLTAMEKERVTLTNMIPIMLNRLVNTEGVSDYDFSSLRVLLSGGAPIAPKVVENIMDVFGCDYIQTYGMTETSPYLTVSILKEHLKSLPSEERFQYKSMTGRAFLGVELKVIREDGTEIDPDGREVGEVVVKGDTITPGYWNRPEETEAAFRDGWLCTGDLAVLNREGYINIVDRKKDMIITGGENVYSTEVENVLYAHPDILEAAVIGLPNDKWGEIVTACVVVKGGSGITKQEVIDYCKQNIASYKSPKRVEFLPELPKLGSGKLYKKGLREQF